jgi:long-chain fatty acid transport protein
MIYRGDICMRIKKIVLAMFAVSAVASQLAYATNGDEMMAVGAQNTALGGTGVANFTGAESTWANPAMLGKSKSSEVTGGVNLFTPKVNNTGMPNQPSAQDSYEPTSYIPDVSYSSRVNDSWSYGVAVAGIAGMGVDYQQAPASHVYAKSALSILRVLPTIAYNTQDYGLGLSPIFQSGSLRLSYNNGNDVNPTGSSDSSTGFGLSLGGYFNASSALTVAASYQSEIAAKYGSQISTAGSGFGLCSAQSCYGAPFGDDLNQPAQLKAGLAYTVSEGFTVTADYKLIQWGSAKGYKDFDWQDETVVAVGAKYTANDFWLGLGYNNANNPIGTLPAAGASNYRNAAINFFNNMFFPAVVTNSYTLGGGYNISKTFAVEGSAVITPQVTTVVDVSGIMNAQGASGTYTNTTTHSQQAYEISLRYKF